MIQAPNKKDIKTWVKALRSGKYSQTKKVLQSEEGYCCLGVACTLFIKPVDQKLKRIYFNNNESYKVVLSGGLPRAQQNAPNWLQTVDTDFYDKTGKWLNNLNDNEDFTFDEIADVLEAVYILEVLK